MTFKPGQSGNPKGRAPGTQNRITKAVKTVFEEVFTDLQGDPQANLTAWAKKNTTDFYKLASKLIPQKLEAEVNDVTPLNDTTAAAKIAALLARAEARKAGTPEPDDGSDLA